MAHAQGALIIAIAGEIDSVTAARLREFCLAKIATQPPMMAIDLQQVTFVDSQGLAALVAIHRRAGALGVTLRMVGPDSASPAKVLAITSLDGWLPLRDSLTGALQIGPDRG